MFLSTQAATVVREVQGQLSQGSILALKKGIRYDKDPYSHDLAEVPRSLTARAFLRASGFMYHPC